jgi:hypothetical protein
MNTTARTLTVATATLTLSIAAALPALARQDPGVDAVPATRPAAYQREAPAALGRIGTQVVRCDTGEGNLSGAGAPAPWTLPTITSCSPITPITPVEPPMSPAKARQLAHELVR